MASSRTANDAAAASNTPAAVRTNDSISVRPSATSSTLSASEAPAEGPSGEPSARANASAEAMRRSGWSARPARSVSSSAGETPGTCSASRVRSSYAGGLPVSSVHSVAATPNTSLRGEIDSPTSTSGAMNCGVPTARVPGIVRVQLPRDAEVHEHDPGFAEDQVARLHVPVQDLLVVYVLKRLAGLDRVLDRLVDRQPGRRPER